MKIETTFNLNDVVVFKTTLYRNSMSGNEWGINIGVITTLKIDEDGILYEIGILPYTKGSDKYSF